MEKEERDKRNGGGGCYLVALSLCCFFSVRLTTEATAEYIHTCPPWLLHIHTNVAHHKYMPRSAQKM